MTFWKIRSFTYPLVVLSLVLSACGKSQDPSISKQRTPLDPQGPSLSAPVRLENPKDILKARALELHNVMEHVSGSKDQDVRLILGLLEPSPTAIQEAERMRLINHSEVEKRSAWKHLARLAESVSIDEATLAGTVRMWERYEMPNGERLSYIVTTSWKLIDGRWFWTTKSTNEPTEETKAWLSKATRECRNNMSMLWKLQQVYKEHFGGKSKLMPSETGSAFWLKLEQTKPPMIDANLCGVYVCPVTGEKPRPGFTNYLGPSEDVNLLRTKSDFEMRIVGACLANHRQGSVIVVLGSGDVREIDRDDPLAPQVYTSTKK